MNGQLWLVIMAVAAASFAIKAAGPALLGDRDLPPRAQDVIALMAPALLTALVVADVFGGDRRLEVDARAVGVAAAGLALLLRASMLVTVVVAAVAAALARVLL